MLCHHYVNNLNIVISHYNTNLEQYNSTSNLPRFKENNLKKVEKYFLSQN